MQRVIVCGAGSVASAIARALRDATLDVVTVADAPAVERAVAAAQSRDERIDALVTVPPERGPAATILTTPETQWDDIVEGHLTAIFLACKAVMPHLIEAGGGAIVNVADAAGYGRARMLAESASHGGIIAFSAALAYDHFNDHVRVNTIVAGDAASPDDIAPVAAFLLSTAAEVMSGSIVDVGNVAYQGGR
jgi:NAD(P)-dependent dehydrogenase (short-subunit alcohol dehydrogenase family)